LALWREGEEKIRPKIASRERLDRSILFGEGADALLDHPALEHRGVELEELLIGDQRESVVRRRFDRGGAMLACCLHQLKEPLGTDRL
jgi:hypothetical protein